MKTCLEVTQAEAEEAAAWLGRSTPKMPGVLAAIRHHLLFAKDYHPEVPVPLVELWLAGQGEKEEKRR